VEDPLLEWLRGREAELEPYWSIVGTYSNSAATVDICIFDLPAFLNIIPKASDFLVPTLRQYQHKEVLSSLVSAQYAYFPLQYNYAKHLNG